MNFRKFSYDQIKIKAEKFKVDIGDISNLLAVELSLENYLN